MTKREEEIYNFIISYMKENLISPTVREIGKGVGLKSTSSVQMHLKKLEGSGYIISRNSESRTIRPVGYKLIKISENEGRENNQSI